MSVLLKHVQQDLIIVTTDHNIKIIAGANTSSSKLVLYIGDNASNARFNTDINRVLAKYHISNFDKVQHYGLEESVTTDPEFVINSRRGSGKPTNNTLNPEEKAERREKWKEWVKLAYEGKVELANAAKWW